MDTIIIVLIFVLMVFIGILHTMYKGHKEHIMFYHELNDQGCTFSPEYEKYVKTIESLPIYDKFLMAPQNFIFQKNGIIFEIIGKSGLTNSPNRSKTIMVDMSKKFGGIDVRITKRPKFERTFGVDKGSFSHLDGKLKVNGSDLLIVDHLLSERKNIQLIHHLLRYTNTLDLGNKIFLNVLIPNTTKSTLKKVIELVSELDKEISVIFDEQHPTIKEIEFSYQCDISGLKCIICLQEVNVSEKLIMNCCGSLAHESHIMSWFEKNQKCPYCQKPNLQLLKPIHS